MTTKEIVTNYFDYVNTGQWDKYIDLFDENIVMDEQLLGHVEGIEALKHGIEQLKNSPKFTNTPLEIVVEGNKAMAVWHIEAIPAPGINIDVKGANYYEITNGKITYFSNYHDTAPFAPILANQ